jgi:hypothetical protein
MKAENGISQRTNQRNVLPQAIKDRNLDTFSFDRAQGGTLVLGGADNGNGLFRINDSDGDTIVQGDNTGITITDGKLVVQNSTGQSVIDASGLVSQTAFNFGSATSSAIDTTNSATYTDAASMSVSFSTSRTVVVMVFTTFSGYADNNYQGDSLVARMVLDGVQVGPDIFTPGAYDSTASVVIPQTGNAMTFTTVAAGNHTLKLQFRIETPTSGDVTLHDTERIIGYMIMGN